MDTQETEIIRSEACQVTYGDIEDYDYDIRTRYPMRRRWTVDKHAALSIPEVRKAILLPAERAAKVPFDVFKNVKDGREVDDKHLAQFILKKRPAKFLTPFQWKRQVFFEKRLFGNSYWIINRDSNPVDLTWCDPESVAWFGQVEGDEHYIVRTRDNEYFNVRPENMLHFRSISFDGIVGISPLTSLSKTLGLNLTILNYTTAYFESSGKPSIIVKYPATWGKDTVRQKEFLNSLTKWHCGSHNAFRPMGIEGGMDITQLPINNETAQTAALSERQIIAVANAFNVKPHFLGVKVGTSYASQVEEDKAFLEDLDGDLTEFEEVLESQLLSEKEILSGSHFIEGNRDAIITTDKDAETARIEKQVQSGLLGYKEMRRLTNRPADIDDKFMVPANMVVCGPGWEPIEPPTPEPDPNTLIPPQMPPNGLVEPQNDVSEPQQEAKDPTLERQLTEKIVSRLVQRVQRSLESSKNINDQALEIRDNHEAVFQSNLDCIEDHQARIDQFFDDLTQELQAITREDVPKINWQHYTEVLCGAI